MDQLTKIKEMIAPIVEEASIILYDVCWRNEGKTRILEVSIMREDGSMDIDTCCDISERISLKLDAEDVITSEYFLEVCSPGAERELRSKEEIEAAVGEFVYIKLKNPKAGLDEVKGTLQKVENDTIYIEYMLKAVRKKTEIMLDNISYIRLSVKI